MYIEKKIKIICFSIILAVLISILIFCIEQNKLYVVKEVKLSEKEIYNIKSNLKKEKNLNIKLNINNNEAYYNKKENIYYYYIDSSLNNSHIKLKLKFIKKGKYNYVIHNNYKKNKFYIDFDDAINLTIYDNDSYFDTQIKFICIPIMNIEVSKEIGLEDTNSVIDLYGINNEGTNVANLISTGALIRIRGNSAATFPKKPYHISLGTTKNKKSKNLLAMRENDDWTLDPLYNDPSKVRSKLAFDLWNEMNSKFPNNIDNNLQAEYVNLYLNGEYKGIYLLKEQIGRKTLELSKTTIDNSGILLKGFEYLKLDKENYKTNKTTNVVMPFEMKYPKNLNNYSKYWDYIIDKIYNYYFDKENINDTYLNNNFNINNLIDYNLFISAISARDNATTNNVYISLKNMTKEAKVILTPWDLDQSFGLYFSGELPTYLRDWYWDYKIEDLFMEDVPNYNSLMKNRYLNLRENILSIEHVNELIDSYYKKIKYSTDLDNKLWLPVNIEEEINKVKDFYSNRINFLDDYVGEYDV